MDQKKLIEHIQLQLDLLYLQLKENGDVSPAQRLRLEGQLQLLLDWQLLTWPQLKSIVEPAFKQATGSNVEAAFWQWCEQEQYCRLPYRTTLAPVS